MLHGGFGLLTVGNLPKPRWWGLWMLQQLADERLEVELDGDGAGDMIGTIATTDPTGRIAIVAWNGTVDVTKSAGDPRLDRAVSLMITELEPGRTYRVRHRRVDEHHSNVPACWRRMAHGRPWPADDEWEQLRAVGLEDLDEPEDVVVDQAGTVAMAFDLPMPSISLIEPMSSPRRDRVW